MIIILLYYILKLIHQEFQEYINYIYIDHEYPLKITSSLTKKNP